MLTRAEAHLQSVIEGQFLDENPQLWVAYTVIRSVRIYSKSSNGIPGLRGLGLKETLELAEAVLEHEPRSDRDLTIHSYKSIAAGIAVGR